MTDCLWIISTTVDNEERAQELARGAVEARLAACAQIDPSVQSHYIWEGALQQGNEWRIHFKTVDIGKTALAEWILAHHPYDVPELLASRAESLNPDYTDWAGKL